LDKICKHCALREEQITIINLHLQNASFKLKVMPMESSKVVSSKVNSATPRAWTSIKVPPHVIK